MSEPVSRRQFIRGAAVAAGALLNAAGPASLAAPSAPPQPAYGPRPGIAKLNANENPYGPSTAAREAMALATAQGAYYIGNSAERLVAMIAERHALTPDHIVLSSGSSAALMYLAVAKAKAGKILGPDLFWDTTTQLALRQGGAMIRSPKTADLSIDLDALLEAITPDVSMVQICNPNNPTGLVMPPGVLREFCIRASKKCTVLIDEAYNEITDNPEANSMVGLVAEGYDVYVSRTFSKIYGLAGLRVGYMIAAPPKADIVRQYSLGNYAMNQAGVAAAVASYDDTAFVEYSKSRIIEGREMLIDAARKSGLKPLPSQTNFVFVDLGALDAEIFRQQMEKNGVLIRGIYQDYTHWSRVSCGRIEDVQRYADALPRALDAMNA